MCKYVKYKVLVVLSGTTVVFVVSGYFPHLFDRCQAVRIYSSFSLFKDVHEPGAAESAVVLQGNASAFNLAAASFSA